MPEHDDDYDDDDDDDDDGDDATGIFHLTLWANSEDPDEMLQIAAFHQGLHCLLRQNQIS